MNQIYIKSKINCRKYNKFFKESTIYKKGKKIIIFDL